MEGFFCPQMFKFCEVVKVFCALKFTVPAPGIFFHPLSSSMWSVSCSFWVAVQVCPRRPVRRTKTTTSGDRARRRGSPTRPGPIDDCHWHRRRPKSPATRAVRRKRAAAEATPKPVYWTSSGAIPTPAARHPSKSRTVGHGRNNCVTAAAAAAAARPAAAWFLTGTLSMGWRMAREREAGRRRVTPAATAARAMQQVAISRAISRHTAAWTVGMRKNAPLVAKRTSVCRRSPCICWRISSAINAIFAGKSSADRGFYR